MESLNSVLYSLQYNDKRKKEDIKCNYDNKNEFCFFFIKLEHIAYKK